MAIMGEYADLMLSGEVCEFCGCELGEGPGYPRRCHGCGGNADEVDFLPVIHRPRKHKCGHCPKKFRAYISARQHERDAHGIPMPTPKEKTNGR
jgi:hypothetical protein